ncbi:MAG: class I SAM-dependent methyltransferase [Phycisphaerales bacterium]
MGLTSRLRRFIRRHAPSRRSAFTAIYHLDDWNAKDAAKDEASVSGPGSTLDATFALRKALPTLITDLNIRSILDAPCGDCRWIRCADLAGVRYTGADIVEPLIEANRDRLSTSDFTGVSELDFTCCDLVGDPLPKVDLIMCRDCLVHLKNEDVLRALANFRASGSTWLLTTTFPDAAENPNLKKTGAWRPINLQLPSFNLPVPERVIKEHRESGEPESPKPIESSKSMGLWRLN